MSAAVGRQDGRRYLDTPFLEPGHGELARKVDAWALEQLPRPPGPQDRAGVDATCRALVRALGRAGWTRYSAPLGAADSAARFDVRALTLIRETLAWHDGLADFAFAMQGLGSGAIAFSITSGSTRVVEA